MRFGNSTWAKSWGGHSASIYFWAWWLGSRLVSCILIQSREEVHNIVCQEEDLKNTSKIHEEVAEVTTFIMQTKPWMNQMHMRNDDSSKSMLYKHCQRTKYALESCLPSLVTWSGGATIGGSQQCMKGSSVAVTIGCDRGFIYADMIHMPNIQKHEYANYMLMDQDWIKLVDWVTTKDV